MPKNPFGNPTQFITWNGGLFGEGKAFDILDAFTLDVPKPRQRLRALERGATEGNRGVGFGPGEPPEGFVGGTTSRSEWYVYWAMTKLMGPEGNNWAFQESFLGGRYIPGGSVADFVAYTSVGQIIMRVQSFYFHTSEDSFKQGYDIRQKTSTIAAYAGDLQVIDLWEQDFIHDPSGRAVIEVVQDALAGIERRNPIASGLVFDNG
jgi:hypothetical protein